MSPTIIQRVLTKDTSCFTLLHYRRPTSSKFQNIANHVKVTNPSSFQQANNNLLPISMEILQQDLVDPDLSNSDVRSLREQGQKQP
jgi:hypothetical protein